MIYLSVMIGGGLGSLLRFLISSFGFLPFATVFINIVGSFILGFLTFFFLDRPEVPPDLRFGLTSSLLCFGQFFRRPPRRYFRCIFGEELLTRFRAQTFTKNDFEALKRVSFSFVFSGKA